VRQGKPDPEGFLHAFAALRHTAPTLTPRQCLVIEDSLPGIQAGQAAGMKVLAVANTHAMEELTTADARVLTLEAVNLEELASRLFPKEPVS